MHNWFNISVFSSIPFIIGLTWAGDIRCWVYTRRIRGRIISESVYDSMRCSGFHPTLKWTFNKEHFVLQWYCLAFSAMWLWHSNIVYYQCYLFFFRTVIYINVRQFVDLCMIFNKRWELHFVYSAVINEYNSIKNKTVLYHSMIKLHVILQRCFKALHLKRSIHLIEISLPSLIYINSVINCDPPSSQFSAGESWWDKFQHTGKLQSWRWQL